MGPFYNKIGCFPSQAFIWKRYKISTWQSVCLTKNATISVSACTSRYRLQRPRSPVFLLCFPGLSFCVPQWVSLYIPLYDVSAISVAFPSVFPTLVSHCAFCFETAFASIGKLADRWTHFIYWPSLSLFNVFNTFPIQGKITLLRSLLG